MQYRFKYIDWQAAGAAAQQETPRLSKEEYAAMRKAEREELQARVDAQAQEVFRDDASMKGFLNFMAQCTPQSTRNLLILYEQDPTITHPRTSTSGKRPGVPCEAV